MGFITFVLFMLSAIPAFVTRIVWTVSTLMSNDPVNAGQIALAILGILAPPVGVVHGWVIWF